MLSVRSRRALLAALAAVAGTLATVAAPQLALAASDQEQTVAQAAPTELPGGLSFSNGFARLADADPDFVGEPLSVELPGDQEGSTIQKTTTGVLLYWQGPGHPAAATDGFSRAALVDGRGLVTWTGDALDPPPPPPPPVAFVPAAAQPTAAVAGGPRGTGAYIVAHSGWDAWHVACGESHLGLAMWNPRPWPPGASTHAAGYFGWLPGTAASVGVRIGDLASEVSGFNRMVAAGRRGEFAGWRSDCPAP